MLWNYLQQITFHLHSSITKYIVKTFVIFAAHLHLPSHLPGHTIILSFGTFLSDWIARFWKYCLIHSRLRTMCYFLSYFYCVISALCNKTNTSMSKVRHPNVEVKGPKWKRGLCVCVYVCVYVCVCVMEQQRQHAFIAKRKRPSVLKSSTPFNDQLPSTSFGKSA